MLVHRSFRFLECLRKLDWGIYDRIYIYAVAKTSVTKNWRSGREKWLTSTRSMLRLSPQRSQPRFEKQFVREKEKEKYRVAGEDEPLPNPD